MIVKDVKLTLLRVNFKEGIGKKSGKPYAFHTASVVDEDANVFGFNIADDVVTLVKPDVLLGLRNKDIVADVGFTPKGFDVSGSIVSLKFPGLK